MAVPNNQFQNVATYQKAELAWMLNQFWAIGYSNKKFQNFDSMTANLGDTVTFDLAPRASTINGLIISTQQSVQRVQSLTCSQAANTSSAYTAQQFIFNADDYMDRFGKSRITELSNKIEKDVLLNIISSVRVSNPEDPRFGQIMDPASGPYRYFGDGTTPINSYTQLAQAVADFQEFGSATENLCSVLPMRVIPQIIGTGLTQFAPDRNNDIAYTWNLGEFSGCDWSKSNLLPVFHSGNVGNNNTTLTLVSTNDPTGANVTQLTFSGATALDPNAIVIGDMFTFQDGVSGQSDLRFLTFIGHSETSLKVQFRATTAAVADGSGNVTFNIYPALSSTPGINQNINHSLNSGMQVKALPSHRAGLLMSGNPLYLAMPQLPDEPPFPTVTTMDPDSGASIRHYWGSQFGKNNRSYVWDSIWGSTLVAENSLRFIFPL